MNTLRESLDDYLALRRALGFKLRSEGAALSTFVAFMEQNQADYISTARALEWAKLPALVQPGRWTSRLGYIRGLARYCSSFDLRTEVPPVAYSRLSIDGQHPISSPTTTDRQYG